MSISTPPVQKAAETALSAGGTRLKGSFDALSFLSNVPAGQHLVVYHEDDSRCEMIIFWYLLHGLVKGEDAVYMSFADPSSVKERMHQRGIDVDYYEKERRLLHVVQAKEPSSNPGGLEEGVKEIYRSIFAKTTNRCRVVGTSVSDISTESSSRQNLEVEFNTMAGFHGKGPYSVLQNLRGSMLCHYKVSDNNLRSEWFAINRGYHHASIYVPNNRKAMIEVKMQS